MLPMENGGGILQALVRGRPVERIAVRGVNLNSPQISWDGKWLAYVSSEGGLPRVYIQPFPSLNGRWVASPDGGVAPRWSRDGSRLFHLNGGKMMEVSVEATPVMRVSTPRVLFQGSYLTSYDVAPDNKRFLMLRPTRPNAIQHLVVVLNAVPTTP